MIRKLESKPFLFFFRDHLRSTLGITCGRGSFAVQFGDHLRSRDHLRYCTVLTEINRVTVVYFNSSLVFVLNTIQLFELCKIKPKGGSIARSL